MVSVPAQISIAVSAALRVKRLPFSAEVPRSGADKAICAKPLARWMYGDWMDSAGSRRVQSCQERGVLISVRVLFESGVDPDRAFDRFAEVRGTHPRHTLARADGEAVNAANRVDTKLSIVPSGGVDGCRLISG
jgi:hypothetical protein